MRFLTTLLVWSALLAGGARAGDAPPWPTAFVRTADVPRDLAGVVVLDTRDKKVFRAGHIAFAVRVDWLDYRAGLLRDGRLPDDEQALARDLAKLGVDDGRRVLVCGAARAGWGEEGRVAWMLRYLGHPAVAVLDGGCDAWRKAGRAWGTGKAKPRPGRFTARPVAALRAQKLDVRRALNTGEAQLLDTRTRAEFDGETPYFAARGGHIPGARHLWFKQLLDEDGRALSAAEVRTRLRDAGIEPDKPVIAYCTGGVRSAMVTAILRAAGVEARNYDGSWWEWAGDRELPVE